MEASSGVTRLLYRLRSLTDEYGRQTIEDVILRNQMFWSSPASFNDPMDCSPNLIFGKTKADQVTWIKAAVDNQLGMLPRPDRRRAEKEMLKADPDHHARRAKESFAQFMEESAVCCFSKRPDNLLMWAHYGDCHRGLNLIFKELLDVSEGRPLFAAYNVIYTNERPEVDVTQFGGSNRAMEESLLTKASDWKYEEEKRMFDYRNPSGQRPFPPQALKGVILGARTSDDDKAWVAGLIEQSGRQLEVWQATLSETEFRLELTRSK